MLSHYGVGQKRKWVQAALRRPSSTVTVRGRPSPEKLLRVFYSPKLWVCRGGCFPCVGCPSWRHFPRAWDPLVYFAGSCWGRLWQRQPENKQGRVWGLFFFFHPLCSLHQTPSASQPTQIWYGAFVGNGLSGARYVSVAPFLSARSARSCRQQLRLNLEISPSPGFAPLFMRISATIENYSSHVGPLLCRDFCSNSGSGEYAGWSLDFIKVGLMKLSGVWKLEPSRLVCVNTCMGHSSRSLV